MASVSIPLGVANVRRLRRNLKRLSSELRDTIPYDIAEKTSEGIAEELRDNLAGIKDVDGNYLGTENPNAAVTVKFTTDGATVFGDTIWRGKQIAFVEFGTGARGWAEGIDGQAEMMARAGYHPDPTKVRWDYMDAKLGLMESRGLEPQAPMYYTSLLLRSSGVILGPARKVIREAVRRAVNL